MSEEPAETEDTNTASITPTVGRMIHYHKSSGRVLAATIAGVNDDGTINLGVLNSDGTPFNAVNVTLVQAGDDIPDHAHAQWMAYQQGQAVKTEDVSEAALNELADIRVQVEQLQEQAANPMVHQDEADKVDTETKDDTTGGGENAEE